MQNENDLLFTRPQNLAVPKLGSFTNKKLNITQAIKFVFYRVKSLWEKEKMLVASIFSFSHNVFKCLFLFIYIFSARVKSGHFVVRVNYYAMCRLKVKNQCPGLTQMDGVMLTKI